MGENSCIVLKSCTFQRLVRIHLTLETSYVCPISYQGLEVTGNICFYIVYGKLHRGQKRHGWSALHVTCMITYMYDPHIGADDYLHVWPTHWGWCTITYMYDPHIEADDFILLILKYLWQIESDNMIDQTIIPHNYYILSLSSLGIYVKCLRTWAESIHKTTCHKTLTIFYSVSFQWRLAICYYLDLNIWSFVRDKKKFSSLRRGTTISAIPHVTQKEETFTVHSVYMQSYRPESLILEDCIIPR